jgi:hypothetical protein
MDLCELTPIQLKFEKLNKEKARSESYLVRNRYRTLWEVLKIRKDKKHPFHKDMDTQFIHIPQDY